MKPPLRIITLILLLFTLLAAAGHGRAAEPARLLEGFPRARAVIETSEARHELEIFLAVTSAQRAQGLMFIRELGEFEGMLFSNREPAVASMWMKNTLLSLDMLFIGADGRIVRIVERTTPLAEDTISSAEPVMAVLELAGGFVARHDVRPGDRFVLLP